MPSFVPDVPAARSSYRGKHHLPEDSAGGAPSCRIRDLDGFAQDDDEQVAALSNAGAAGATASSAPTSASVATAPAALGSRASAQTEGKVAPLSSQHRFNHLASFERAEAARHQSSSPVIPRPRSKTVDLPSDREAAEAKATAVLAEPPGDRSVSEHSHGAVAAFARRGAKEEREMRARRASEARSREGRGAPFAFPRFRAWTREAVARSVAAFSARQGNASRRRAPRRDAAQRAAAATATEHVEAEKTLQAARGKDSNERAAGEADRVRAAFAEEAQRAATRGDKLAAAELGAADGGGEPRSATAERAAGSGERERRSERRLVRLGGARLGRRSAGAPRGAQRGAARVGTLRGERGGAERATERSERELRRVASRRRAPRRDTARAAAAAAAEDHVEAGKTLRAASAERLRESFAGEAERLRAAVAEEAPRAARRGEEPAAIELGAAKGGEESGPATAKLGEAWTIAPPSAGAPTAAATVSATTRSHTAAVKRDRRAAVRSALESDRDVASLAHSRERPRDPRPRSDDPAALADADTSWPDQEKDSDVDTPVARGARAHFGPRHREHCPLCRDEFEARRSWTKEIATRRPPPFGEDEYAARRARHEREALRCETHGEYDPVSGLSKACYAYRLYLRLVKGYRSGWGQRPIAAQIFNYASVDEHREGSEKGFVKVLEAGAFGDPSYVEFLREAPSMVHPFTAATRFKDREAAKKTGQPCKVRLCLDLSRNWNEFADAAGKHAFRYAGYEAVAEKIREGDFTCTADLASYYTQLAVALAIRDTLVCEVPWVSAATRRKYNIPRPSHWDPQSRRMRGPFVAWQRCPFGISRMCAVASLLTAEICKMCEARGVVITSYIDDALIIAGSEAECAEGLRIFEGVCADLGLLINEEKTTAPSQTETVYLGVEIDTVERQFTISVARQEVIAKELRGLLARKEVTVSAMRSACGRLTWASEILRGARSRSRPLYRAIAGKKSSDRIVLDAEQRLDLEWFIKRLEGGAWRGSQWLDSGSDSVYVVKSDASDSKIGAIFRGRYLWYEMTEEEQKTSSHAREFLAAALVVETFGDELRGRLVTFVTDNSGTASTFSTLSTSDPAAQQFCRRLGDACLRFDCDTAGMWQPREMNVVCDALSKLNEAPVRAVWVAFSAEELESSMIDVGTGCLLVPRGRCAANGCHVGYISTAGDY